MKAFHALTLSILTLALATNSAMANFDLASNGKPVICYGPDNMYLTLNAKRTTLKITVEGEGAGARRILKTATDNRSFASFTTSEGTLVLSNKVDTFSDAEGTTASDEPYEVDCK